VELTLNTNPPIGRDTAPLGGHGVRALTKEESAAVVGGCGPLLVGLAVAAAILTYAATAD
jgi:hypothetical protein